MADMVVTVSYAMKDELSSWVFPKKRSRSATTALTHKSTILKTFPKKIFKESGQNTASKTTNYMILFLGRLVGVKGVDKLIMAMPHILSKDS